MVLFLRVLLLAGLSLCFCHGVDHFTETWVSCTADETALAKSSVQKSSFPSRSLLHCLSVGTHVGWAAVACFSSARVGNECNLWAFDALNVANVVKDPSLGITPCKTPLMLEGCQKQDGSLVQKAATFPDDFCPAVLFRVCLDDYTTSFQNALPQLTQCTFPFTMTPIGCIYIALDQLLTWCQARARCLQYGGDLMSPDTHEEFNAVRDYLRATYGDGFSKDLWMGLQKVNGVWQWMFSGRSPGADNQGDWHANDPNGAATDNCARMMSKLGFKMGDKGCEGPFYTFCRARLVPKL